MGKVWPGPGWTGYVLTFIAVFFCHSFVGSHFLSRLFRGSNVPFPFGHCVLIRCPGGQLCWFELRPDVNLVVYHTQSHLRPPLGCFILEAKDDSPTAGQAALDRL